MSAVFGFVDLNGNSIAEDIENKMAERLGRYKLDIIKSIYKNNIFFGCGMQFITPESLHETLPYYDEKDGLVITADAIIDNRKELFELLNIIIDENLIITDSQLILMAYKKWKNQSPKYLIGSFSFVIWDEKNRELFCANDHVGTRTFYYYFHNKSFIFSTLIKPICCALDKIPELNEKWITDFLALPLTLHQCESNETIYENIYQLPPACTLLVSNKGIVKNKYWNPLKEVKTLKLKSDAEYEEAFKKIFSEAVRCRLRSNGEIGIMLSGGMDSGSVGCVAAIELAKINKRLNAFSSIPITDFKNNLPKYKIPDESEYIECIKDRYENIDINYCRCEGKNSITDSELMIDILEQPHKIIENLFWFNDILAKASKHQCKIMLNGQLGNYTISYGDFITHVLTMYKHGKLFTVLKELQGFSRVHKISKAKVGKIVFKAFIPYKIREFIDLKVYKNPGEFDMNLVNKSLAEKWNIKNRYKEHGYYTEVDKYYDLKETREFMVDPVILSQIASVETKFSLVHGMIERDPTRDKRVIEFCMSLPSDQFVRNGQERYLIRRAMNGILPDKIRLNTSTRGLQSADWIQRLEPSREEIYMKLLSIIEDKEIEKFLNIAKLKDDLISLGDCLDESNGVKLRGLLVSLIFSQFIRTYNI